ncbi:MAG: polyphosphate kinase 1 [Planctomycetota bacterium]|nr:polyphosphate kinase 1 [Planctomycetota bacterium]
MTSTRQATNVPNPSTPLDSPILYLNRELSWLEFNRRVLEEAQDPTVPLLERLKFLAITESNLDEFFMVRVGGLQQKRQSGVGFGSGADRTPVTVQLERIGEFVRQLVDDMQKCLGNEVLPGLQKEGIVLRNPEDLTPKDRDQAAKIFRGQIFPVLTPLAIDPGHPFPHLLNKSLNLVVKLVRKQSNEPVFAVVQVPSVLPRFVTFSQDIRLGEQVFVSLESIIREHLHELFPGMDILYTSVFRVTRNSDFEIDDDEVEDLLKAVEEEIRKRRRGMAVRLQLESRAPVEAERFLVHALDLDPQEVFRTPGMVDMTGLFQIHGLPGYPHLRDPQHVPLLIPEIVAAPNIWAAIKGGDILMHHPYDSFSHVVDFIEAAANDERVLAIKQTLYRTSSDSPIIRALQRAADNGKQVTAVVEIKARLDEERNILWARELEKVGVHVVFGFVGLKTHCKVSLVVRREEDGIKRYVHMATGNYNHQTARIYTDLGYFTCRDDFCEDASNLFNYLTGFCEPPRWRQLVIAPSRLQNFMLEKIGREADLQKDGKTGRIIAKINGVLEPAVIQALYKASQAGVKIDIICRGICALKPGIAGISDNIRVISIIDRFLEHSRIFYFGNEGDPEVFVGSADWMDRNLIRRVEVVFPIVEPRLKTRIIDEILATSLADNVKARELHADGSYTRLKASLGTASLRSQDRFLAMGQPKVETDPTPPVNILAAAFKGEKSTKSRARKKPA